MGAERGLRKWLEQHCCTHSQAKLLGAHAYSAVRPAAWACCGCHDLGLTVEIKQDERPRVAVLIHRHGSC